MLAAASERDRESDRILVHTHLRITESIESDMLSHDRHISIKLWSLDHSSLFDYAGVHAAARARCPRARRSFEPMRLLLLATRTSLATLPGGVPQHQPGAWKSDDVDDHATAGLPQVVFEEPVVIGLASTPNGTICSCDFAKPPPGTPKSPKTG